jgi:hypothetical protein
MVACDRFALALLSLASSAVPAAAADPERARLLAAEAARASAEAGTEGGVPAVALVIAAVAGCVVAGLVAGALRARRRRGRRNDPEWRELTYRYKSTDPIRLRHDTLRRVTGVLDDLQEIDAGLRGGDSGAISEAKPAPTRETVSGAAGKNGTTDAADAAGAPAAARTGRKADTPDTAPAPVTFRRRAPRVRAAVAPRGRA